MSIVNFYIKQTVLNEIMSNTNTIVVSNSQLNDAKYIAKQNSLNYEISSVNNIDENNIDYYDNNNILSRMYASHFDITPSIPNKEIIENIKFYNNCEYSIEKDDDNYIYNFGNVVKQNGKYDNFNFKSQTNSLIYDYSYNSLYYLQYDKLNLLSYSLDIRNGFNYNNHMLYFDIDHKYVKSVNNTLYYDYNHIKDASNTDKGISYIDDKYFDNKNNLGTNTLSINKKFKYNTFASLKQLKELYNDCVTIYDTLSYYSTLDIYHLDNKNIFKFNKIDHNAGISYVKYLKNNNLYINQYWNVVYSYINHCTFEDTNLYLTDSALGVSHLNIKDVDTIYVSDLNNVSLYTSCENTYIKNNENYKYYKNNGFVKIDFNNDINIDLTYKYQYSYVISYVTTNFIERSNYINEQNIDVTYISVTNNNTNTIITGITYNLSVSSSIDKTLFENSGINILYKGLPYVSYISYYNFNQNTIDTQYRINDKTIDFTYSYMINDHIRHEEDAHAYTYYKGWHTYINIPLQNDLNICKINNNIINNSVTTKGIFKSFFEERIDFDNDKINTYFILSSKNLFNYSEINNLKNYIELKSRNTQPTMYIDDAIFTNLENDSLFLGLKLNNNENIRNNVCILNLNIDVFNKLFAKNLITENKKMYYYKTSINNNESTYYEWYPVLNTYPNKYLNDKFFDSELYNQNIYTNLEELDTCISDIKNIKDGTILYLYEISHFYNNTNQENYYSLIFNSIVNPTNNENIKNITNVVFNNLTNNSNFEKLNLNEISNGEYKNLYDLIFSYTNNFIQFK